MTLPVPLAVRVGDSHITPEVAGVQFRKEAIGGVRSITLSLSRPLDRWDDNLQGLSKVSLHDARSAECIAEGRLDDPGRSAGTDGQTWSIAAFGPAQHATDKALPLIYVDTRLDQWKRSSLSTKNATTTTDERDENTPTLCVTAEEGKTVAIGWIGDWTYRGIRRAGMKLARVRADHDSGVTQANYELRLMVRTGDAASPGVADSDTSTTAGGTLAQVVGGTNFNNGNDVANLRCQRVTTATTGAEAHWFEFWDVSCRALLLDKDGTEITTGYGDATVLAHEVVKDLLGRVLGQYDGANATVATSATYAIDQLAYPDGVTAEQVLDDLMLLEPAYRWYTTPDTTGNGYGFRWELWPTTVRYEVSLDDGGSFPSSWQEVYDKVTVRWNDKDGKPRTTTVTSTVTRFDEVGMHRWALIDAADEYGSATGAQRAGENFLAEHRLPKNAGTLNINRPIRDLTTGRMVEPFEIEPGELIRVRGIESYPDALNASSNDGLTVFRIWAMSYNSDGHTASLELDTDARSTTNALRKALKRRHRKR